MIETIQMLAQLMIALGILNVWLIRFGRSTKWRGGDAQNMRDEFTVYGLPSWFMLLIGTAKVILALTLIAGFWFDPLTCPAAAAIALLMSGAVVMHFKVGDPVIKSLPAIAMLAMALFVACG